MSKSKQPHEENQILSLPKEVLEVILNYIPQKETLNLRLVCNTWNQDVENLYNYEVKHLDEDSPNFQRILVLRINKLSLSNLKKTSVLNSEGISIFKYPEVIRVLKTEWFSSVSPENLQQLLGLCAETVRILHLNLSYEQVNYEFTKQEVLGGYTFSNLKELRVLDYTRFFSYSQTVPENSKSLFQVLENSRMPQLRVLRIHLYSSPEMTIQAKGRIGESILRILSRNGIHLEILDLNIFNYTFISELEQLLLTLRKEELDGIMQMNRIQEFNVRFKPFALQLQDFWQQVLANQKQLVSLNTSEFSGGQISIPLCRQIILKNSATLFNIEIYELDMLADDPPFDLSVFQACCNLKELYLHRIDVTRTDPEQPDVRQFHCLPESITKLTLVSLKILSEELLIGFTQGLKNLQTLNFYRCGKRGLLGVNIPVLSEILMTSRPSLTEVRFYLSLNWDKEAWDIVAKELFRLILYSEDLIDLERNCSVEPGCFDWVNCEDEDFSDTSDH